VCGGDLAGHAGHLERLQRDAAECKLISQLTTDKAKRELFAKLALHFEMLAKELEGEIDRRNTAASPDQFAYARPTGTAIRLLRCTGMPQYFFDFSNGTPHRDEVGEEMSDDRAAWREALRITRELEDVLTPGGRWYLEVRREDTPLFRIEVTSHWFETDQRNNEGTEFDGASGPTTVG